MMPLPVWMPGPMFLRGGWSGLCLWCHVPPRVFCLGGVSVQVGFCPGGSLSRGVSVCTGFFVWKGLCLGRSLSGEVSVEGYLCPRYSHMEKSGHYASYWNAFLLDLFLIQTFCDYGKVQKILWGEKYLQQECIPVGCVPAYLRPNDGVCFPGGCLVWGGSPSQGGVCSEGVSALGGVCSGGCLLWGGFSMQGGDGGLARRTPRAGRTPPPLWTEWQTGVKILPWPKLRFGR